MTANDGRDAGLEYHPDGTLVLARPVPLPEVLDILIVGGGPFGTATAFRAKELGLSALVIDHDDLMKRIRDYPKDKQILPDFGGGDRMQFPRGGKLISRLQFGPIEKDAICAGWKNLYKEFNVAAQIGVEMIGLERQGEHWRVTAKNHSTRTDQFFTAKHVVLAFGRGEPRRLEISGEVQGLAYGLSDAAQFVGDAACVIGGGTSAAEAVIAISNAKAAAGDPSQVYWSYRGDKMPKVSSALADAFFASFFGNGNIRYLPKSEPLAVVGRGEGACLSVRTGRTHVQGQPTECVHLEFLKHRCVACTGEDIPEALLTRIGVPLVTGGPSNKKRIVVTPLLETRQPNVYLAGDVLSNAYLEAKSFEDDPAEFVEVKRRGNIKAAMRDGVFVAEVIAQKLAGNVVIKVVLDFVAAPESQAAPVAGPAVAASGPAPRPAPAPALSECSLVSILPSGVEAQEYPLKRGVAGVIGRLGADICFPDDTLLSDRHAMLTPVANTWRVHDVGSARGTYVQPAADHLVPIEIGTMLKAGNQWLRAGDARNPIALVQFNASGAAVARFELKEGLSVVGREAPDVTLGGADRTLSRRHLAFVRRGSQLSIKDLGSANGTLVAVTSGWNLADGDRILVGGQVLEFTDDRASARPEPKVVFDPTTSHPGLAHAVAAPTPALPIRAVVGSAAAPARPAAAANRTAASPASGEPSVFLMGINQRVVCKKGQSICEALEGAGIKLDADCHRGSCGSDLIRVVEGRDYLNAVSSLEKDSLEDICGKVPGEYRLACVARVTGPVTVAIVKQ